VPGCNTAQCQEREYAENCAATFGVLENCVFTTSKKRRRRREETKDILVNTYTIQMLSLYVDIGRRIISEALKPRNDAMHVFDSSRTGNLGCICLHALF
jgi:hypothetical protein